MQSKTPEPETLSVLQSEGGVPSQRAFYGIRVGPLVSFTAHQ